MRTARSCLLMVLTAASATGAPASLGHALQVKTVASGLDTPWDLEWGPDGAVWVTERPGRISRVDVASGQVTLVGEIEVTEVSESGLMGMAFHPDFRSQPYVYLAHSYRSVLGIRNRLIRMRYASGRLADPETLLDGIPGAGNHNGARLAIGPDRMLYLTTGDAGDGSRSQDRKSLAGKVLRLTLEGKPAPGNPFGNEIWSYGHRNPQGIAFQPGTSALYVAEHGPSEADEVNLVEPGRNYGWPEARGACDRDAERDFCGANNVMEPVIEFTPTLGIADSAFAARDTLLVTALSGRVLLRISLSPDGRRAAWVQHLHQDEFGRIRDVLVGPDGAIYLATSNRDGRGFPAADDDRILRVR